LGFETGFAFCSSGWGLVPVWVLVGAPGRDVVGVVVGVVVGRRSVIA
jgi:hypothetical protein